MISRMFPNVAKVSGARILKIAMIARSTRRIWKACALNSRPDRQVNAGGNDHVGHADSQHRENLRVLNYQPHVPERCESIRCKNTEDRDDCTGYFRNVREH